MGDETKLPQIVSDDFGRRFSVRAPNLMWLLGAGASGSAGIPTASDMVWEFKQQLYISQRRVSRKAVADLSSPAIRAQIQGHVDSLQTMPPPGAPDEYAALFEAVYPAEVDRHTYLESKMTGAKPSFGHLALATLMRAQLTRLVWTTNFDPLVADACAKVYGATGPLTTVTLDAPDLATQRMNDGRWPIEIKLHGDFRSRRLKNTGDELRHQDERLRQVLIDSCGRFGLVVVGYSGRDDSVMDALEMALERNAAFPSGLFWLHRGANPPLARVQDLLIQAKTMGVEAALVRIENFDETMRDLVRLVSVNETGVLDAFAAERPRWTAAPRPSGRRGMPAVRLNAVPVIRSPTVCRRIVCQIGGYKEVRAAIEQAGVEAIVARTKEGVLAYGADAALRAAFEEYHITDFDLSTIDPTRLRYDSPQRGLLRDALTRALGRQRKLDVIRRRSTDLLAPADPSDGVWAPLRRLSGELGGTVNHFPNLSWREGIRTRLDWADDRLWLLFEPCTVFHGLDDDNRAAATDFARERTVKRYNRQLNDFIGFWAESLGGDGGDLRALNIGDGVDAGFVLSTDTGFSRRAGA